MEYYLYFQVIFQEWYKYWDWKRKITNGIPGESRNRPRKVPSDEKSSSGIGSSHGTGKIDKSKNLL